MDRESILICNDNSLIKDYPELFNRVYKSRKHAYEKIDEFINKYKKKYLINPELIKVIDSPKYVREGFDSEDEYLSYKAYTG